MSLIVRELKYILSTRSFIRRSVSLLLMSVSVGCIMTGLYYSFDVPGNIQTESNTDKDFFGREEKLSDAAKMRLKNSEFGDVLNTDLSQSESFVKQESSSVTPPLTLDEKIMQVINSNPEQIEDPYEHFEDRVQELSEEQRAKAKRALMAQIEEMEAEESKRIETINDTPFTIKESNNETTENEMMRENFPTESSLPEKSTVSSDVNYGVNKNLINDIMNHNLNKPKATKNSVKQVSHPKPVKQEISMKSPTAIGLSQEVANKKVSLMPVEVSQASTIELPGVLVAKQAMALYAPASGQVKKILARSGDYVRKDQIILQLETPEEEAEFRLVEAELHHLEKQLEALKEQNQKNSRVKQKIDETELLVNEKKAQYELVNATIQKKAIKAPFGGYLGQWEVQAGGYVKEGLALNQIVNKNDIQVEYELPEKMVHSTQTGEKMSLSLEGRVLDGIIRFVSAQINPETSRFIVRAQVERGYENLIPGMRVVVYHPQKDTHTQIWVPSNAVLSSKGKQYVYKWVNNQPHLVQVSTLPLGHEDKLQVISGLTTRDQIVVFTNG